MLIVDPAARTIAGRAVPWDTIGEPVNGWRHLYPRGMLQWGSPAAVRLLLRHDNSQLAGRALKLHDRIDGLWALLTVDRGDRGDRALELAKTWGLSIGLDSDSAVYVSTGVYECCHHGKLVEISLTPTPAFAQPIPAHSDAKIGAAPRSVTTKSEEG